MNTQPDKPNALNEETIWHATETPVEPGDAPTIGPDSTSDSLTDAGSLGNADNATVAYASSADADTDHADTVGFSVSDDPEQGEESSKTKVFRPKRIGDYVIERVLGEGGMGIVYKAKQSKLGRIVALKMIRSGVHTSSDLLNRFESEAKAVAHLQHPNIVQIFEIGEHENLPYFSLEFVDGVSLDKKLDRKPLTSQAAAQLTITLCGAMQYAHDHGVLHRDLKPANVLISKEEVPKVTDFGLAKFLEDEEVASSTQTGTVMGTPSYMSPEQARGEVHELGPTTDQYSLGAMLYEFLTGRPPFTSPSAVETVMQVRNNEPLPPRQLQPKLPVDIETICLKALQKDPVKRYASCQAMAEDLARFLRNEPILARPVTKAEQAWRWCRRNPVVASLSLAASTALIAVAAISSWSAMTLAQKNKEIKEKAEIAQKNEARALEQEDLAKQNEKRAIEQEGIANSRATSLIETVKDIYSSVNAIDIEANPRMEEPRRNIMKGLLPLLEREVLTDMPKDDQAQIVRNVLLKSMADNYVSTFRKEDAAKLYYDLEKVFQERADRKKNDAARNNLAVCLRSLGDLKREYFRDLDASQSYFEKQLEIAQDMWQNSRSDDKGAGQYTEFQRAQIMTRSHFDLAVTLYRMGKLSKATLHFKTALNGYKRLLELHATDPWVQKLPPTEQRNLADSTQRAMTTAELAYSHVIYRTGNTIAAEPIMRRAVTESKSTYERDIFNAVALREYVGRLGLLAEMLAQTGRTDEAMPLLGEAAELGTKLLSLAPTNSELQRAYALSQYRLCQWRRELKLPDADKPGENALRLRRQRVQLEPMNDRFRIEQMLSEAQFGDIKHAEELIDTFSRQEHVDNEMLIELARSSSLIASRSSDTTIAEQHLSKAVEAIKKAIAAGYEDLLILKKEVDFRALQSYPPFVEIVGRP